MDAYKDGDQVSDILFSWYNLLIEGRAEIVCWVSESVQPFKIVKDQGFQSLMKMGWPGYYIPSASMVSHDVKFVFAKTQAWVGQMLQVINSEIFIHQN